MPYTLTSAVFMYWSLHDHQITYMSCISPCITSTAPIGHVLVHTAPVELLLVSYWAILHQQTGDLLVMYRLIHDHQFTYLSCISPYMSSRAPTHYVLVHTWPVELLLVMYWSMHDHQITYMSCISSYTTSKTPTGHVLVQE